LSRRSLVASAVSIAGAIMLSGRSRAQAPAPPPPPPAAKVFTIYFAYENDDEGLIGLEGLRIIRQAADVYKAGGVTTVQVTGYTDTLESTDRNLRISVDRARDVVVLLRKLGVPPDVIAYAGRGENDLAVPTPDRVREPRNRRVTIVMG
jgi:OmpA-OmpF porin, OOP family